MTPSSDAARGNSKSMPGASGAATRKSQADHGTASAKPAVGRTSQK